MFKTPSFEGCVVAVYTLSMLRPSGVFSKVFVYLSSYYILIIKFYKLCLLLSVPPFQKIKFWCSLFHKFMVLVYHNLKFYVEKQDSVRFVEVKTSVFLKVRS